MKYVVVDIGCIECGEPSTVLGIFDDKKNAEVVAEKYSEIQDEHWQGDHDFIIFEVEKENEVANDDYYAAYLEEKQSGGVK